MLIYQSKQQAALAELARRSKIKTYQTKPDKWLVERLREDDKLLFWDKHSDKYALHQWDGTPNPFAEAFEALADKKWVGIESGTSLGKTYFLPRVLFWFLDTYPNSLVVTTAPKLDQLRRVLWTEISAGFKKFKRIRPDAELYTLNLSVDGGTQQMIAKQNSDILEAEAGIGHEAIGIVSGVGAGEESATKMQGFHRENMLFIVEECAGVHPAVLTAIINTSTAANNLILAVGNPDSEIDSLHTFCQLQRTKHIIVSAYDHPNVVIGKPVIPGAVTRESIEFRREEYGEDSPFFKSRVRGIAPTEAVDSLIKSEYFEQCLLGSKTFNAVFNDRFYYNAAGIDVANSESGDMGAAAVGKGNRLDFLKEFHCPNANHLAYNLLYDEPQLIDKNYSIYHLPTVHDYKIAPENVGVDSVGVGVGTVNAFHDEGYPCISLMGGENEKAIAKDAAGETLYRFASLRAQMYFEAREDLRLSQVIIGNIDARTLRQLKKELITVKYRVQGGKIYVESKEEIKKRLGGKSPNLADAYVYWNWMKKGYYTSAGALPFA